MRAVLYRASLVDDGAVWLGAVVTPPPVNGMVRGVDDPSDLALGGMPQPGFIGFMQVDHMAHGQVSALSGPGCGRACGRQREKQYPHRYPRHQH